MITYAHRSKTLRDRLTVGCIPIPDERVGRFVPRKGLGDLLGDPLSRRIGRHAERYQPPALVPQNDQNEEQPKADCVGKTRKSIAPMPPHSRLARLISRIRRRISPGIFGRPA